MSYSSKCNYDSKQFGDHHKKQIKELLFIYNISDWLLLSRYHTCVDHDDDDDDFS